MIINRKIILITLISLILFGCGYTPLYTSKQNINFNIISVATEGDNQINNYIKSNLAIYMNKDFI